MRGVFINRPLRGAASTTWRVEVAGAGVDVRTGLSVSADKASALIGSFVYALHYVEGTYYVFEPSGGYGETTMLSLGAFPLGALAEISYDGTKVIYAINGTVQRTIAAASGQLFYAKSLSEAGARVTNFYSSTNSNNNWGDVAGTGRPADGATVGADWGGNLTGRPANVAALAGTEGIQNALVTLTGAGALSGAGGGAITGLDFVNVAGATRPEANATVGATWGGNLTGRPTNVAALAGTEGIQNALVTLTGAGALSGAGGGSITALDFVNVAGTTRPAANATVGAAWGTNLTGRPTNVANLVGTEGILNSGITLSGAGVLSGAGGGSISALDYSDVSGVTRPANNATVGADWAGNLTGRPTSLANVLSTDAVENTLITLSGAGVLSGAGGGSISALDYSDVSGVTRPANNATVGADWAGNLTGRPTSLANVLSTDAVENALITLTGAGALSGAGGGSITALDFANVGGSTRPADYATQGATWSGTLTGRPNNLALLGGTEGINNANITLTGAGALSGAGGGSITALDFANVGGTTRPEADATVDANIAVENPIVIFADATGTPKTGQLSRAVAVKLVRNGVALTSGVTWTVTRLTGNATHTVAGTGTLTFTITGPTNATLAVESVFRIVGSALGIGRTLDVKVVRQDDPPTQSGGSGTTVATNTLAAATTTTYPGGVSSTLRAKTGSTGSVRCTAPISYKRSPGTATGQTRGYGKWQWRAIGGTWADITTEVTGGIAESIAAVGGDPAANLGSTLNADATKSSLSVGVEYEFQFMWRYTTVSGDVDTLIRVSGTMQAEGK